MRAQRTYGLVGAPSFVADDAIVGGHKEPV
jgi:hypothetical protein